MPEPGDFEALVARLRHEYEATPPTSVEAADLGPLLDDVDRGTLRRLLTTWGCLAVALMVGIASVVSYPLIPSVHCDFLDRADAARAAAIPLGSLVAAALLIPAATAGAQILARALLWSSLALGTVATIAEPGVLPVASLVLALAAGFALLLLGEHGLEPERYHGAFVPAAYRRELTAVALLSVADAQTLLSWTTASAWYYPAPGVCGVLMATAALGLLRLELWGLVLNVALNVLVAVGAAVGLLSLPTPLVMLLVTTSVIQLVFAAPVLYATWRGVVRDQELGGWPLRVASRLLIVAMLTAGLVGFATMDEARIAASCEG